RARAGVDPVHHGRAAPHHRRLPGRGLRGRRALGRKTGILDSVWPFFTDEAHNGPRRGGPGARYLFSRCYSKAAEIEGATLGRAASLAASCRAACRYACAAADCGCALTIGLPASPCSRIASSSGRLPSNGTPYASAIAWPPPLPNTCSAWPQLLHTWTAMFS